MNAKDKKLGRTKEEIMASINECATTPQERMVLMKHHDMIGQE